MIREHEIVQVDPKVENFGGCFVVVDEVHEWGVQGYVQNAGSTGQAWVRLKHGDFEITGGMAVWGVGA